MVERLEGWQFVDLGPDGGPYDDTRRPKLGLHTWESYGWAGAESAFRKYPPHLAANWKDQQRKQYVRLDRHAYSFFNSEADDEYIIQIELAGYAGRWHEVPDSALSWIGKKVIRPILDAVGIPPIFIPFVGNEGYGSGAAQRISLEKLRSYTGILGHQHIPGDSHWDPGHIPIEKILRYAYPEGTPMATIVPSDPTALVEGLYQLCLGTSGVESDPKGVYYWVNVLTDTNTTPAQFIDTFVASAMSDSRFRL